MKIGFFTDSYLPIKYGMETSIESFRLSLEKMGHEVYIYAPHMPGYKDENTRVFRFISWQPSKKADMRLSLPIPANTRSQRALDIKLDVIHAHTPFSLGLIGMWLSKKQRIPLIYTHHTDYGECIRSYMGRSSFSASFSDKLSIWFSNRSNTTIAPSEKIKTALTKLGLKENISVLPTGTNVDIFRPSEKNSKKIEDLKTKYNLAGKKILVTLSRIGKEKNVELLIRSFSELLKNSSGYKFIVVGKGPDLERLKELSKNLGIEKDVIFSGFVPEEEKPAYYQMSHIFLYGSYNDTQGMVILEAMASGLPIIAVDDGAFYDMVKDGENGYLVKNASPEIFAKKISEALKNEETLKKLSSASLNIAESLSEERMTERLVEIYAKAISNKAQKA